MRQIFDDDLGLNEYQLMASNTAIYPGKWNKEGLNYTLLGLLGEAGEIANKYKKILRDDGGEFTPDTRLALADEAGDTLWYLGMFIQELGYDFAAIAKMNRDKLAKRASENAIKGSGDSR